MGAFNKRLLLAVGAVPLVALISGCAGTVGVGYRVYDPYYTDYHVFGPDEVIYYNRWLDENHMRHRDFRRLRPEERRRYYEWRHNQRGGPPERR